MERFSSFDGTAIAYEVFGEGPDVLLLHGFGADHRLNWVAPGIVDALVAAGHRVIAPDARGHGESDRPHDPSAYAGDAMAHDARALLDHLGVDEIDVVGYSMGSLVSLRLAPEEPRTRRLVLGGIGGGRRTLTPERRAQVAEALLAERAAGAPNRSAQAFREFADRSRADLRALAAVQLAPPPATRTRLDAITVPTLVVVGDRDLLAGSPSVLADRIRGATVEVVPGDHLSAVLDPGFPQVITRFLAGPGGVRA